MLFIQQQYSQRDHLYSAGSIINCLVPYKHCRTRMINVNVPVSRLTSVLVNPVFDGHSLTIQKADLKGHQNSNTRHVHAVYCRKQQRERMYVVGRRQLILYERRYKPQTNCYCRYMYSHERRTTAVRQPSNFRHNPYATLPPSQGTQPPRRPNQHRHVKNGTASKEK